MVLESLFFWMHVYFYGNLGGTYSLPRTINKQSTELVEQKEVVSPREEEVEGDP